MTQRQHLDEVARTWPLGTCAIDQKDGFAGWVVSWTLGQIVTVDLVGGKGNHPHSASPDDLKSTNRATVDHMNGVRS